MRIGLIKTIFLLTSILFLAACDRSPEPLLGRMLLTENTDDLHIAAAEAMKLREQALPIFIAVLNQKVRVPGSVMELQKFGTAVRCLHDLARQGIHSEEAIPLLIEHIERTPFSPESRLAAADTLKIITGVDTDFTEAFVQSLTDGDSLELGRKLSIWRDWYAINVKDAGQ